MTDEILEHLRAMRAVMAEAKLKVKELAEGFVGLSSRMEIIEGRQNTIDDRLARIEKHTGLVIKA